MLSQSDLSKKSTESFLSSLNENLLDPKAPWKKWNVLFAQIKAFSLDFTSNLYYPNSDLCIKYLRKFSSINFFYRKPKLIKVLRNCDFGC